MPCAAQSAASEVGLLSPSCAGIGRARPRLGATHLLTSTVAAVAAGVILAAAEALKGAARHHTPARHSPAASPVAAAPAPPRLPRHPMPARHLSDCGAVLQDLQHGPEPLLGPEPRRVARRRSYLAGLTAGTQRVRRAGRRRDAVSAWDSFSCVLGGQDSLRAKLRLTWWFRVCE
jgi:hypothetical protein